MKRMILCFGMILFFSTALITCAQTVVVYRSGDCSVDIDGKGQWVKASVDMVLNPRSVVKTGRDSIFEISIDGESVVVASNSTVTVGELQNRIQSTKRLTWFRGLYNAFHTMISGRGPGSDRVILGVRGAKTEEGEVGWIEDIDTTDLMDEFDHGIELYNNEDWRGAIEIFSKLVDEEDMAPVRGETSFYLGSALFNNVQYEEAITFLAESIKEPDTFYREAALINYSLALFFAGNYTDSVRICRMYGEEYTGGEFAPYAFLIAGKSYKSLGKREEAKKYFRRIVNEYPQAGVYQDAVDELKGM